MAMKKHIFRSQIIRGSEYFICWICNYTEIYATHHFDILNPKIVFPGALIKNYGCQY